MTIPDLSLRMGERHDLQLVIVEPLFEEANRCRRLIVQMMRALDARGIGSWIMTLPGCGESLTAIATASWSDWRAAASSINAAYTVSMRGGALLDDAISAKAHWRFAPETGTRIVRDLKRTALAGASGSLYAGHALDDAMLEELEGAVPQALSCLRTVRLETDALDADVKVQSSPMWRRAEPGEDDALSTALAADIAKWIATCAG